jgi:hypothetical protein
MNPLFTVHAGEYLLASYIERRWRSFNVWVPSKDTGVDLLVSDHDNRRTVTFQVKFSKDYLYTTVEAEFREDFRACGWWRVNGKKLTESQAEFWVFVLNVFKRKDPAFVIVPREELAKRLATVHKLQNVRETKRIETYLTVTEKDKCWETRGLGIEDQRRIVRGEYQNPDRDFTQWLNNWDSVTGPLGAEPESLRVATTHS